MIRPIKNPFLLFLFSFALIQAQEIPPIQNFTPNIYGAEKQNWKISQAPNKQIYIANNNGLLEFNGSKWELYPSPNNSIIRSVSVVGDLIYTGSHREFGVWERNQFGKLVYHSISSQLKEPLLEDEEFWNIVEFEQWVLFQSLNRIYIYNSLEKSFKIINSKSVLEKIFKTNNSLYFQKTNEGLFKIENGNTILVSDDPILKENILVNIHLHNKKTLLLTQEKGFFELENNKLKKWNTTSNDVISSISVYSSLLMHDGSFVLGTVSNGIYHLDEKGNLLNNIDQKKGLNNNTVLSMFEDQEHNLWLGLDNGISVLNLNSPIREYIDINGELGTVYASTAYRNNLYLGTNQGLFYKNINANDDFKFIEGTEGQVWSLNVLDNTLFCGHNTGTYTIDGKNNAIQIASIPGTWNLKPIPNSNHLILQGNYDGLYILEKKNNRWSLKNKIKEFNVSSRFFEISENNQDLQIIVNHEYKGIFKLRIDKDYSKIIDFKIEKADKGSKSGIAKYKDELIYCNNNGIYLFDHTNNTFVKDSLYSNQLFMDEKYVSGKLLSSNDKLWGFTDKSIVYFSPGKINKILTASRISLPSIARKDYAGYENITHLKDELYLFGTSNGFFIIDIKKLEKKNYAIQINEVLNGPLYGSKKQASLNKKERFAFKNNNLDLYFSVPVYDKYSEVIYQYKLIGMYDKWSEWSSRPEISFKNLPFGKYTFVVRAKIGNKDTLNKASYSFKIERPWYLSNKLLIFYVLLFGILILTIHNSYERHYKKQKENLILKKQQEFERAQLENEKEIMTLKNDKLRHDIDSKNRELAASTMSIIKKNEFLNTIKKELSGLNDPELVKPMIKIINKNLNHTSDWELFQKAFNNADKDFLKKIKDKYPNFTPNDLRLCAYLRLNLSSKEIAPLLNISHKSVEIKRYRLRKKMNLNAKDNLIHHILEV